MKRIITDYLDEAVGRWPDKTAFVDEKGSITYRGLQEGACAVAQYLIAKGLYRKPVAIFMEKSIACVCCMLGAVYSANFYSVLDTQMPNARLERLFDNLEPEIILMDEVNRGKINSLDRSAVCATELFSIKPDMDFIHKTTERTLTADIMYIMYTSGSTGEPKGVVTSHDALMDFVRSASETFGLDDRSVFGNQAQLHYGLSAHDVYCSIYCGATVHLLPYAFFLKPKHLMNYIRTNGIDTLIWSTAAMELVAGFYKERVEQMPSDLRKIIFVGAQISVQTLHWWREALPQVILINSYGLTETFIRLFYSVDRSFVRGEIVPVGGPLPNTEVLLLDEDMRPVKGEEKGRLYLRCATVSYGYYKDRGKTGLFFVNNPLCQNHTEWICNTGDIAQRNDRGEIVIVGRADMQIKKHGYRIELGEIEAGGMALDEVKECCALFWPEKQRIVFVYVGSCTEKEVEAALRDMLPQYMMPDEYIRGKELPHLDNGKLDRMECKKMAGIR